MAQEANGSPENRQPAKRRWITPVRVNLLVTAILIPLLNGGIIYLAYIAITSYGVSEFVRRIAPGGNYRVGGSGHDVVDRQVMQANQR